MPRSMRRASGSPLRSAVKEPQHASPSRSPRRDGPFEHESPSPYRNVAAERDAAMQRDAMHQQAAEREAMHHH